MGHFYDDKGNPKHRIVGSNGVERDSNIGDARKRGWTSSVTTIINVLAKPGLDFWKTEQLLDAAIREDIDYKELEENPYYEACWKERVLKKGNQISNDSRKEGDRIHGLLDRYFKDVTKTEIDIEVMPVLDLLDREFGRQVWLSEVSFSHKDGFAGQVDLHSHSIIIDFKTKIKPVVDKTCLTPEYLMQIAAYRKGLDLPQAKCYNLFISTSSDKLYLHEYKEEELIRGLKMFEALLSYYKLVNKL